MTLIERLNELCRRHEGVTPGEWTWDCGVVPPDGPGRYADIYVEDTIIASFNDCIPEGKTNAAAIADIPTMLAVLREAAAELSRLTLENEALKLQVKMRPAPEVREDISLINRNAELTAEVERLRADAERWRLYAAWQNGEANPPTRWADYTFEERAYAVDDAVMMAAIKKAGNA